MYTRPVGASNPISSCGETSFDSKSLDGTWTVYLPRKKRMGSLGRAIVQIFVRGLPLF